MDGLEQDMSRGFQSWPQRGWTMAPCRSKRGWLNVLGGLKAQNEGMVSSFILLGVIPSAVSAVGSSVSELSQHKNKASSV